MLICRTIVNGLCYLATFVYGFNSLGLFLYSGQLALSPITDGSMINENENKGEHNVGSLSSVKQNAVEGTELTNTREREERNPDDQQ
ncbi:Carbamoyl phosphate synthetase B [Hibiscus syriacus]|uniref:Carbamoyl phosphate synthetase B n=1 Tax=Hibiscus syriacus TaxID=106335 RepID=A0A6A2Y5A6_HIBSY|nr:Carbamoyl phosphate synthetase B [Hibiscus syriacus]